MSLYDTLSQNSVRQDEVVNGIMLGVVTNNSDPKHLGRVKVQLTVKENQSETYWAPVATLMAGPGNGAYFVPDVGDKVLVAFLLGDIEAPYVIGKIWDDENRPPIGQNISNGVKKITSRMGHEIILDDLTGKVTVHSAQGQTVEMDDSNKSVTLSSGLFSSVSVTPMGVSIMSPTVDLMTGKLDVTAGVIEAQGLKVDIQGVKVGVKGFIVEIN